MRTSFCPRKGRDLFASLCFCDRKAMIMLLNRDLERAIFPCPEVDCRDFTKYPSVSQEEFLGMADEFCRDPAKTYVFPFVHGAECGEGYLEVYVWDPMFYPDSYRRYVICEGYCLPEAAEESLLDHLEGSCFGISERQMDRLNEEIGRLFPEWNFLPYESDRLDEALKHAYYASHRCGAREIMYKAGLNIIAEHLDEIPTYNLIGTSPEMIVGDNVPLRLLKILNRPELFGFFADAESLELCRKTYQEYSGYFDREIPSGGQWCYLAELCKNGGKFAGHSFSRSLYRRLAGEQSGFYLKAYEEFLLLRDAIPEIRKMKLPRPDDVCDVVEKLNRVRERETAENSYANSRFELRKRLGWYEYSGEKYEVIMPGSVMDVCKEALAQGNCVMEYTDAHASSNTTILFVRRKEKPKVPFVTMEVEDWEITQVYAKHNRLPRKDVYEFLEEYAKNMRILYNPCRLIEGEEEVRCHIPGELWDYAEDYRYRMYREQYPGWRTMLKEYRKPEECCRQMTLRDCFPDSFTAYVPAYESSPG